MADIIFPVLIWLMVFLWILFGIILAMHFLMPAAVLEKYFRAPYFKEAECKIFTGFPFAPMRTVMLMGVLAFPGLGKKRKLTEAHLSAPGWYITVSTLVLVLSVLTLLSILILAFGFYFYNEFFTS